MIAAPLFVGGAILGSFATALAHRLPRGENWVSERSQCPGCGAQIRVRDNIPIVSWLALRGRCRDCGERISSRYPLTELALGGAVRGYVPDHRRRGVVGAGAGTRPLLRSGHRSPSPTSSCGSSPTRSSWRARSPRSRSWRSEIPTALLRHAASAAIAGGLMFVIALAYPRGMGMGDAKLVAMIGLFIGRAVAPGDADRLRARGDRRRRDDRPPGLGRPQAGDPVRAVPRRGWRDRPVVRGRHGPVVPGRVLPGRLSTPTCSQVIGLRRRLSG